MAARRRAGKIVGLDLDAFMDAAQADGRVQSLARIGALLFPEAAAEIGAIVEQLPELAQRMRSDAAEQLRGEVRSGDRALAATLAGILEDLGGASARRSRRRR